MVVTHQEFRGALHVVLRDSIIGFFEVVESLLVLFLGVVVDVQGSDVLLELLMDILSLSVL